MNNIKVIFTQKKLWHQGLYELLKRKNYGFIYHKIEKIIKNELDKNYGLYEIITSQINIYDNMGNKIWKVIFGHLGPHKLKQQKPSKSCLKE